MTVATNFSREKLEECPYTKALRTINPTAYAARNASLRDHPTNVFAVDWPSRRPGYKPEALPPGVIAPDERGNSPSYSKYLERVFQMTDRPNTTAIREAGTSSSASEIELAEAADKPFLSHHIADILARRSETEWLPGLENILERRVVAVLAGPHGSYKSAAAGRFHILAALAGVPGMMCYGEGAGLDRRLAAMLQVMAPGTNADTLPLFAIEKRVNFSTPKGLEALRADLRARQFRGGIITIDTYSKYAAGLDQNDNAAASAYIAGLDSLRREFDSTILLITHTGHSEKGRARGASSLIDDTEAEYVAAVNAGVVSISRDRFKDSPSLPPLTFKPRAVQLTYCDRAGQPVTGLVLDECNAERVTGNSERPTGDYEPAVYKAFQELTAGGDPVEVADVLRLARSHIARDKSDPGDTDRIKTGTLRAGKALSRKRLWHTLPDGRVSRSAAVASDLEAWDRPA